MKFRGFRFFALGVVSMGLVWAIDCPADNAVHIDKRIFLPDGSPNPTYGQEIITGLCTCLDFDPVLSVTDNTLTVTLMAVDNEPIRGIEVNIYNDSDGLLVYSGLGSVGKGDKFNNATDPTGAPANMEIMANEINGHVKVLAYSRDKAQTSGDGTEGSLFHLTYGVPGGVSNLPDTLHFAISLANVPGTSFEGAIMNVVCSYPDSDHVAALVVPTLGVDQELGIPTEFALDQNYPNPFNPTTRISFALPEASHTSLRIYNVLGEKVAELVNADLNPGYYHYQWNARTSQGVSVATGVYFYELRTDQKVLRKKMVLLR
ncbi:MAG: T9SS C-terminal target domain-containing protein [Candidatus Neomarinimicrobiota bacterium]|nr:MAG: T9SS C-terminal target domain-containing protein [Candidatus Neomarinimicrobiota bacterium]